MSLIYYKLTLNAINPVRCYSESVGLDLFSPKDCIVNAHDKLLIFTDLMFKIPPGCYGRIAPRSGLASKFIDVGGGVIDSNYTGNVGVLLYNFSNEHFYIKRGDKIAQFICEKAIIPILIEGCVESDIRDSERGDKGFGSSD